MSAERKQRAKGYRIERDPLGEKRVPADVLYGVQTLRALENFKISGLRIDHELIIAFAEIKKAAALAHLESGDLEKPMGKAIVQAAEELIEGQWREQLELNVMMPYVAYALLESLQIMRNAVTTFDEKCVRLITAHPEKMREYAERSVGVAALYNEERGFRGAAELAEKAIDTGKSIKEVVAEE